MAKAKKKAVLSLEERLEQALVPEAEQPYTVPENWCWVKGSILLHPMETQRPQGEVFKYIDIDSIDNKNQVIKTPKDVFVKDAPSRASRKLHNGDTIFSMVRPYLKNIAYIDDILSCCIASTGFYVCTPIKVVNKRFFFHLMISDYVVDGLNKFMKGDNSPSIRKENIEEFSYPLPPFTEQQRIVDCIESLFVKLDEAKEKIQTALDSFETRKAAILHKAFTGELTTKWREENGVGIDSWEEKNLQSACSMKITDGTHKTPTYCNANEGIPFISAKDVTSGQICWDNIKYIVPELHEELYARLAPEIDDILLAKNGTTGVAAIVNVTKVFDLYVTLALLRPNKNIINPHYLLNVINSPICKAQFDEHLTGIGVPNLHLRDIKEVLIPLPNLCEQAEIVRLLDDFFAKEQKAKELCSMLDKIDLIKKSILARAFRGELGTNDPAEESALELLTSIV